jgi:SAM-dependent methyltransferase
MQDLKRLIELNRQLDKQNTTYYEGSPSEDRLQWIHDALVPFFEGVMSKYPFESILDVGAGMGTDAYYFAQRGKRVTALLLEDTASKEGYQPVIGDMHDIPLPDESVDAVLSKHVLEHSLLPMVAIEEIRRVLTPGGILILVTPPKGILHALEGHYFPGWSARQLAYLIAVCGFEVLEAVEVEPAWSTCVVGRKCEEAYTGEMFPSLLPRWKDAGN